MFDNKILLITGGTGSFGNAVLNSFLNSDIKEIRVFSRDEKKQDELRRSLKNDKVKFYLGDVRDPQSIEGAINGVNYIFHAAALKQVPSCEFFPYEAVKTNIMGAENVLSAAINHKIEKLVVLSTDKAVYPINAMGISKAMMEKLMMAKSRTLNPKEQVFCGTRYGNVMASRGSVIPVFINQILNNKDITITDPNMTRFLMSLEDSINLVMYAFQNALPGDMFVQKAPATTIETLALALRKIFNAKNNIIQIGTRHAEKTHETLLTREELAKAIEYDHYYRIPSDRRDLNYDNYLVEGKQEFSTGLEYNSENTSRLDLDQTVEILMKLPYIKNIINNNG